MSFSRSIIKLNIFENIYVGLVIAFIKEKVKMLIGLFDTRKHGLIGMGEVTLSLTSKRVFIVSELLDFFGSETHPLKTRLINNFALWHFCLFLLE